MTDPAPSQHYAEDSQATLALILGILGIVLCQIIAPFAWSIGNTEMNAIDAGKRDPSNRGMAQAGKILGIIGTVLLAVAIGLLLLGIFIAIVAAVANS